MDILLLLIILAATVTLFVTRWLPMEVTALLTIAALGLSGILDVRHALAGFSSTATVTVGAMFVLSAGLMRTGALETVTITLARFSNGNTTRLLLLLALIIPLASAFMNNTPVVVMMVPVLLSLSRRFGIRPSKLMIPVSYFAILGGTMTLIGTSTNILIDDLYREAGGPGFRLFTFAPLGLVYVLVDATFIVLFSQRLLPDREPLSGLVNTRGEEAAYITELIVEPTSLVLGKRVDQVFRLPSQLPSGSRPLPPMRHHRRVGQPRRTPLESRAPDNPPGEPGVELLELFRDGRIYRGGEARELVMEQGDALMVTGSPNQLAQFMEAMQLSPASILEDERRAPVQSVEQHVVEAVVLPDSPAVGREIRNLGLYRRFGVRIMGLERRGGHRRKGLRSIRLESGDVLLLQGEPERLRTACEVMKFMLVEGVESAIVRRTKNRTALLIMGAVVLLAATTALPIVLLAVAGAALMLLTKCIRVDEALDALDPATLLLLASTIPLGMAMQSTGLAALAVEQILGLAGSSHPVVLLSAFYLFTALLTQLISNNAVAVLLTPIALSLAANLGIHPTPLLMALAFGSSASFLTPMGYQTNAIVMGPGGYTFADYLRMGAPLTLITWLTATLLIPVFWPL